jgi:DNA-binding NarL/FixJ family response regulator
MPSKPITVLVVDDEERIRRFERSLLAADAKVSVIAEADNGRAAAELTRKLMPDVIVMDISMPVMNGFDAARTILREFPKTRIIMTTAMGTEPYKRVSFSLGAAGFVDKSCLGTQLVDTIHEIQHGSH